MATFSLFVASFSFIIFLLFSVTTVSLHTTIGVTYSSPPLSSSVGRQVPPERIAKQIVSMNIPAVRLLDPDPAMIRSFAYTNTSLLLSIPNALIPPLASNRSLAIRWVYRHILPFYPRSKISMISVGNDAVSSSPEVTSFLLPAIRNVYLALRDLSIKKVSVSTTFSFFNIISTTFPPSAARFQEPTRELIIRPLLQFLDDTNSSFLVNVYPYNVYRANSEIPIGFALFQEHAFNFRDDLSTGVRYRNLFDMMIDAVISAVAVTGHENVPVIVAETGWPSSGRDQAEVDATPFYAEMYLKGLIGHLKSGMGTPLRKEGVAEIYIYELLDTESKQGTKNWGILYQNMTKKYDLNLSGTSIIRLGTGGILMGVVLVIVVLFLLP